MTFERNYFQESAVCPKCGSDSPTPKYCPEDTRLYEMFMQLYYLERLDAATYIRLGLSLPEKPSVDVIIKDKVVCLCRCGYEWNAT